jgi:hypothetical protein
MRVLTVLLASTAIVWGLGATASAADAKATKSPGNKPNVQSKADAAALAQLRAKMHRSLAELIEAENATEKDAAKIEELTKEVADLRAQLQAKRSAVPAGQQGVQPGWRCPWGGPGMGPGRGQGRGPGMGPGPGMGRGFGPGPGPGGGRGPGAGRGAGWGPGFIDVNQNGICDYFESRSSR